MNTIELTLGYKALIDEKDFSLVSKLKWRASKTKYNIYACSGCKKTKTFTLMHRLLLGNPKNMVVDHKNGNGLDNRRENLRACTHTQNTWNAIKKQIHATSNLKGVYRYTNGRKKPFYAKIVVMKKQICLGYYHTENEAHEVYKKAAEKYFGEYSNAG